MNTFNQIEIYSTVSFLCSNPEREEYWLSLFFHDLEIVLPAELEESIEEISKDLVFDYDPIPSQYLNELGITFDELEESDEIIYHQYLWRITGIFQTNMESDAFEKYLNKNVKLDFGFADHVELINGELVTVKNALEVFGGPNCYALKVTALETWQ